MMIVWIPDLLRPTGVFVCSARHNLRESEDFARQWWRCISCAGHVKPCETIKVYKGQQNRSRPRKAWAPQRENWVLPEFTSRPIFFLDFSSLAKICFLHDRIHEKIPQEMLISWITPICTEFCAVAKRGSVLICG